MPAKRATLEDVDWIVGLLAERRAPLVKYAPVFWRPSSNAAAIHRAFVEHLLTDGGAHAYRTNDAVLIAAPRGEGWLVDDAYVSNDRWSTTTGRELWNAFAADCTGADVRFVCPTYERERATFASMVGLNVHESWWLEELSSSGGEAGVEVALPGADAITVAAPPVYAPPGPILFLPAPSDATTAVPAALDKATALGCAAVVVNQSTGDDKLAEVLKAAGLRRHCDYFTGQVQSV